MSPTDPTPLSFAANLSPLFHPLWSVLYIGMQGDVGQCLQGKDKAVISANEAVFVPEHKCANISNPTKACVSEVHVSPPLFFMGESE